MASPNTTADPPASLATLPLELLLEIFSHLLTPLPTHYSYTHTISPPSTPAKWVQKSYHSSNVPAPRSTHTTALRTHGILLANRHLSEHYRTAFYARTNFFLWIEPANAAAARWWPLSPALLPNLRACKLYIEAKRIEISGVDMVAFVKRVEKLLVLMKQLRRVQLVWDVAGPAVRGYAAQAQRTEEEQAREREERARRRRQGKVVLDWEGLGEPFVEVLKGRRLVRDFIVTVGERIERYRREKGEWVELGEGIEMGSKVKEEFPFLYDG